MTMASGDHPVVREMEGQWPKLLAVLMLKLGLRDVEILPADVEALGDDHGIVADTRGGRFFVRLRRTSEIPELDKFKEPA